MNAMTAEAIKTYVEVLDNGGPCPACGRDWVKDPATTAESRTHTDDCPVWLYMNDGTLEEYDPVDTDTCPEHGTQEVTSYMSSKGPDPYAINKLKCGCRVICVGPGEPNVRI